MGVARKRCWDADWVIDLDIKAFFDSLDHELVERAVAHHTDIPWVRLYVARWLRAPVQRPDGTQEPRARGTPQGGVLSPLLANLFLHYAFDVWMKRTNPSCPFARYADDAVAHCRSEAEAKQLLAAIEERLKECRLELHPEKSGIVYCKDSTRRKDYPKTSFTFLGYEFRPRSAKRRDGTVWTSFLPAISASAMKRIRQAIREWNLPRQTSVGLNELAKRYNAQIRGWMNYYSHFYKSALCQLYDHLDWKLMQWARRKYRKVTGTTRARGWLKKVIGRQPRLFVHWLAHGRVAVRTMGAV